MLRTEDWNRINSILLKLYRTRNEQELRKIILKEADELFSLKASFFDLCSLYRGAHLYHDPLSLTLKSEDLQDYYSEFIDKDYMNWLMNEAGDLLVYRDSDFMDEKVIEKTALYKKWMSPLDLKYTMCANIAFEDIVYGSVVLIRGREKKDFSDREVEIMKIIAEHTALKMHDLYPSGIVYKRESGGDIYGLTEREREIAQLLRRPLNTSEIAGKLCISENTLNRHIANIYRKTSVHSRLELIEILKKETTYK
ncbi:MAG: hypothetical protein IKF68_03175 [Erysipelotrichaceae bacterium]|nr:hypothetical protein [Erysipelotrichaceae bacterium]